MFALLVNRHVHSVYSLAYSITGSREDAEDITSDTFLKVWKSIRKYKKEFGFKTWLLTIAKNTAYDFTRKRKDAVFSQFENKEGQNYLTETLLSDEITATEEFIKNEDVEIVRHALTKLSPGYREVLELRYAEEMTFEEIATVLGKPMNTVKSQTRRGLIMRRKIIEDGSAPK